MSYNPGQPTGITKIAPNVYAVESFREEMKTYQVDLLANSCSCPHFTKRLAGQPDATCKHITSARAERFRELTEKARSLPTERLEELRDKYLGQDKAIWLAIDGELYDRDQAAMKQSLRDANLKQIFA